MAVTTTKAHVNIALYLKNKISSTYLGIGRKEPWDDEEFPPAPDKGREELDSPIGYKKVNLVSLCRRIEDESEATYPTTTYRGEVWELIPDDKAYEEGATEVYFETRVFGNEIATGEYRQVGIFTGLEPVEGVTKPNLKPSEVKDVGTLEFFENRPRQNRTENTNIVERFIISVAERG